MFQLIAIIFFAALGIGYGIANKILVWAVQYFKVIYGLTVISLSPIDVIMSILKIDFVLVSATILPLLILFAVWYITPALYERERRFLSYIPTSVFLACIGAVAGYLLALYYFIPFFQKFANSLGVLNQWTVVNLVDFIFVNCMIFMITMQVPLVVTILFNLGILKLNNITLLRKVAAVIAVVFGGIATPTVDAVSQLIVAVPFYLLFEIALQYCIFKQRFLKIQPVGWHAAPKAPAPRRAKRKPVKSKRPDAAARVVEVKPLNPDPDATPSAPPEQNPDPTDPANPA